MGMILECHAVPADARPPHDPRAFGVLISSVSINSVAAEGLLAPLVDGLLAGADFAADGPAGQRFEFDAPPDLELLLAAGVDADIYNAIADAVDEAQFRGAALWIGFA